MFSGFHRPAGLRAYIGFVGMQHKGFRANSGSTFVNYGFKF